MAKILVRMIRTEVVEISEEMLRDLQLHPYSQETHERWDRACVAVSEKLGLPYTYLTEEGHPDGILEVWDENHTDMYAAG